MIEGLHPNTCKIFNAVSHLECIKPYVLVGGTALSLQLHHRLSEDLDFMSWKTNRDEQVSVDWWKIQTELQQTGEITRTNILDINHTEYLVSGVKISFYARDSFMPDMQPFSFLNNIRVADVQAIGAMKMEVLLRRYNFRDYYDIYAILQSGAPLHPMMNAALKYANHTLRRKNLMSMLLNCDAFHNDKQFEQLHPRYDVTPGEIREFILSKMLDMEKQNFFSLAELPYHEFEKIGLPRNELKVDDIQSLIEGKKTEVKLFTQRKEGKQTVYKGSFSLMRNPDHSVSVLFHPAMKQSVKFRK